MSDSCFATLTVPPLESAVCPLVVVEQNSSPCFVITTVCYHNSLGPDVPVHRCYFQDSWMLSKALPAMVPTGERR